MTPTELEHLNSFVGVWNTSGEMKNSTDGPPSKFRATDRYEWLPGRNFLLHHFDADMPDGKVQGIEVIGYSQESNSYPMHSFDNKGTVSLMHGRVDNEIWTFLGESIRFSGGFHDNGKVFAGLWEFRLGENALWQPLMDVTLRK